MTATDLTRGSFAEIGTARLYYEVAGTGQPLLLLHAGIADSRMWDDQWGMFTQHYRVVRCDLHGFGQTSLSSGAFAIYEDIASLLHVLGIAYTSVVGISYGGKIALDMALAHPELVDALVLGAPALGGAPSWDEMQRFGEEEEALLERGDIAGATELNLRMWVDGPHRTPNQVDPVVRERVREMQSLAFSLPMPDDVEDRPLTPPANERLGEIRAPTLVIEGELDVAGMRAIGQRIAAEVPGARLVTLAGVAHMVNLERPDEFNQIVLEFLKSVKRDA